MTQFTTTKQVERLAYKGFTVEIRSDEIWHTVRDSYGEPCGTIERPHRGHGHDRWEAYTPTGTGLGKAVGPRMALCQLAIYHGA